jgi:histidyl-tRNA synthetase
MISRVRGTEDNLDLTLFNFVIEALKKHLLLYNFNEIQTPILEQTSLFVRAVGEQTDIVSKEMYVFDQKDGESICLRPEATSSIVRAYIENGVQQSPWKVFTYGSMFRKERPQKGRWREFSQISIEVINAKEISHDVYFLKMLDTFFSEKLLIDSYTLKLNFLGCSNDRIAHKKELFSFLKNNINSICSTCQERIEKNTLRVFDCKNEECKKIYLNAPKILDFLCKECKQEWETLINLLHILCVNYHIDHFLVRGLDYYNKTVFEFSSRNLGAQNAFCGGGRYTLGKEIGGKEELPSIGVGIGTGRVISLVSEIQNKLQITQKPPLHIIIPMGIKQHQLALLIAQELLNNNLCTEILFNEASISNLVKKANKMGARYTLIIGETEQKEGTVTIKNMQNGESKIVKHQELVSSLL